MSHVHDAVIVGAGFGGMGAAIQLRRMGYDDLLILEREDDLGGTWHVNRYPGLAVDIPSATYSYSFEPNPHWSRLFAPGAELKAYATHVADKYDLRRHMRFGTVVDGARWDEDTSTWEVTLGDGSTERGRYLLTATGFLSQPRMPDIAGIDDFAGDVVHTDPVGRRRRARGQADRHHRHRRDRRTADPQAREGGRPPDRLPAHAHLRQPQARRQRAGPGAQGVRPGPADPEGGATGRHLDPRGDDGRRRAALPEPAVGQRGRQGGLRAAPQAPDQGPGAPGEADARLRLRLQAPDVLQQLLPGVHQGRTSTSRRQRSTTSTRPGSSPRTAGGPTSTSSSWPPASTSGTRTSRRSR